MVAPHSPRDVQAVAWQACEQYGPDNVAQASLLASERLRIIIVVEEEMFVGRPAGITLKQATERKAAAGDPLAQKILRQPRRNSRQDAAALWRAASAPQT